MSQVDSQSGLVALELFKFSFSTSASRRSLVQWTHLSGRGAIIAVFDNITAIDTSGVLVKRLFLKVLHGGEVLVCEMITMHFSYLSVDLEVQKFLYQPSKTTN